MSYQVLARKWRPKTFHEMAGQTHVLRALENAMSQGRLHHAYLFTGTRGVGKTTVARILAKCLNCETGITSTPCGTCSACVEIDQGRSVDLIEVDAASRTRVEDTRELLDNVQYAPTQARFKIYLIDEVHMLSTHSFNALLKTLEEPPEHVKFLLATTDPQKLPVTVLSRCLQFSLKNMIPQKIVSHLTAILPQEEIAFEEEALWEIARAADGSMRDALSLTDQAIAFGSGRLTVSDVQAMLGTIDRQRIMQLVRCILNNELEPALNEVAALADQGSDLQQVLADLIMLLHRVAMAQVLPDAVDNALGDRKAVMALAQAASPQAVQLYYQSALMGRKDLPIAPDLRAGLEMVVMRMLMFVPSTHLPVGTDQSAALPKPPPTAAPSSAVPKSNGLDEPAGIGAEGVGIRATPEKKSLESLKSFEKEASDHQVSEQLPRTSEPEPEDVPAAQQADLPEPRAEGVIGSANADDQTAPHAWLRLIQSLGADGVVFNLAQNSTLQSIGDKEVVIKVDARFEPMLTRQTVSRLEALLSTQLKRPIKLVVEVGSLDEMTPCELLMERKRAALETAKASLEAHPFIKRLTQVFNAQLRPKSIALVDAGKSAH